MMILQLLEATQLSYCIYAYTVTILVDYSGRLRLKLKVKHKTTRLF